MNSLRFLCAATLLLVGCGAPNTPPPNPAIVQLPPTPPAPVAVMPEWTLTAEEEKSLGEAVTHGKLEIRPPADFIAIGTHGDEHLWVGTKRPGGIYPTAAIVTMPLAPSLQNAPLEALLADAMTRVRGIPKDFSLSASERGTINGLTFIRSRWSGRPDAGEGKGLEGKQFHGVAYLTVHQGTPYLFCGRDTAPEHLRSLEQFDAMVHSVRGEADESVEQTMAEHPFRKALKKALWPVLKKAGFQGAARRFAVCARRSLMSSMSKGAPRAIAAISIGAHLDFLPPVGGRYVPLAELLEYHCAFRDRIEPIHGPEFGWEYPDAADEIAESVEFALEAWEIQGEVFFARYATYPDSFRARLAELTPATTHPIDLKMYAVIALEFGEKAHAAELVQIALEKCPERATSLQADLKSLLKRVTN